MLTKDQLKKQMLQAVEEVKKINPMAGSITNSVTINLVANAQLAVGGSAAMVYLPDEAEFLAAAGGATYINVGTLLPVYAESLPRCAKTLYEIKKPWVLDPVAIGIGSLRTELLLNFKEYKPSIIRGNASEIIALAGLWELDGGSEASRVRGVDSTDSVASARHAAISLAQYTGGAVAVSGECDLVTDGKLVLRTAGGSHFFEKITGAGCSLAAVMAVYATAASPLVAALLGSTIYNLAGKIAKEKAQGPASFQQHFLDELYKATAEEIANYPFEMEVIQ